MFLATGGCAKEPYAATTNLQLTPEERAMKVDLTPAEDREVAAILARAAAGENVVNPPGPAPHKVRWSDVPQAADYACTQVEMAVVRSTHRDGEIVFEIMTVEDYPGMLTVRHVGGPQIYEASASIGLFGNHADRADALLAAFHEAMIAFGKKRQFAVDPLSVSTGEN